MKKKFTLIELIIVIVVISILTATALLKITGVVKSARISAMINDKEVLEKTILLYYQKFDNLPIFAGEEDYNLNISSNNIIKLTKIDEKENNFDSIYKSLRETLTHFEDSEENLYKIDISNVNDSLSKKLKYGYEKTDKDFYVYSTKTKSVYYYAYLQGDKEEYYHCDYPVKIKDNELINRITNNLLEIEPSSNQESVQFIEDWAKPLFDSDLSTGVSISPSSPRYLTWEGDLSNNILEMYASSSYSNIKIIFYDGNGKTLSTYNLTSNSYANNFLLPTNNAARRILVPYGAKKIRFSRDNNGAGSMREIKLLKGPKSSIGSIKATSNKYNVVLDFKTDKNFKTLFVFTNGTYMGQTDTNSIDLKRLCADTTYNLQIMALSNDGTCSGIYQYTIKTEDYGIGLYVPKSNDTLYGFIDGDTTNYVLLKYDKMKPEIQFTKELGGNQLVLTVKNYYEHMQVKFYDKDNKLIYSTKLTRTGDLKEAQREVTIPEGSVKVQLYQNSINSAYLSEVSIR